MKMRNILLLCAALTAVGGSVQAEEASSQPETQMEGAAEVSTSELSDDWSDYQIQIDDQVYQFPMTYDELTAAGWTTNEELQNTELSPNQYDFYTFTKGDEKCYIYFVNLALNNEPVENCIVGGISMDSYDWDLGVGTVVLPGGIARGEADVDTIQSAYGTPSDTYEGDLYTKLTYETDYYSEVELTVYKESGVLEEISVRNFVEPENFDAGTVNEEVPEAVMSYVKPEALSDNPEEYQIELDGEVYTVPVPVSVLEADGWALDENKSDEYVKAEYSGWVTLRKGGQEIHELAVNRETYATVPSNCWLEDMTVGGYTLEAEGALPGGIYTGMQEADFVKILDDAGMTYEVDDSSDSFKYYTYNEKEYDQCFEVTVYTGDDGHFEKNTIMEVTCRNAF